MTEPGTVGRESLKPAEVEQRSRRRLPSLGNGALVLSAVIVAAGLIGAALILRTGGDTTDLEEQVAELQQAAKAPGVVVGVELRCNLPNRGSVRGEGCEWYLDLGRANSGAPERSSRGHRRGQVSERYLRLKLTRARESLSVTPGRRRSGSL